VDGFGPWGPTGFENRFDVYPHGGSTPQLSANQILDGGENMSSKLSRIANPDKQRHGPRVGTKYNKQTGSGFEKGPAQQTKNNAQGNGLFRLTDKHDLSTANKKCKTCKGHGTIKSDLAENGRSMLLACKCVEMKAGE